MLQNPCEALNGICHCHLGSVHRSKYTEMEMVQRRSARMVCSDYRRTSSVSSMLQQLQWPTLQERRAQAKVTMMYRIVYQLVDVPTTYLIPISSIRGHGLNYLVPYARTQIYQRSFFPDTIGLWNSLPQSVSSKLPYHRQLQEGSPASRHEIESSGCF